MPRVARVVIPGCPHHVTQRGNNRQDVFFVDDDYATYLEILAGQADRFGLRVEGYCLMPNHVHLIVTPAEPDSIAKAVGRTHWRYTQHVNALHGRSGHLWQNRFYSCGLDTAHMWAAMRYVEQNPVRAKLCRAAWRYRWSSAAAHCGLAADASGLLDLAAWRKRLSPGGNWREALGEALTDEQTEHLRHSTNRGRPLGSDSFIAKLETALGRRLRPLPVGRPKKKQRKKNR